ncbi:hypothetical protein ACO2Q9_02780 [Variovorax sp. VNK109]|uniref:hypothetical protein n=1 Tax=Variovorax sp. VNK109 TaxID=3400919 RepID=UPI003BFA8DAD
MSDPDEAPPQALGDSMPPKQWEIVWKCMVSALYHQKRERFLDGMDRFAKFVGIVAGAAVFAKLTEHPLLGAWFAGIFTIITAASLAYDPASKARRHAELARDFKRLQSEVVRKGELSARDLRHYEAETLILESGEPAALSALVTHCHNELTTALGQDVQPLPLWQWLSMHFIDFDQSRKPAPQ